ncbi:MAG: translation initiation factor [Helicobacter sp.]|nr:translation initiation factor [Helicobacteraceae bacterium]MDY3114219.1 translation initiation factor [Helicobacter sp.]
MFEMGAKFSDNVDMLCKKCGELKSACKCGVLKQKAKDSYFISIKCEKSGGKDITKAGIFFENKEVLAGILKEAKKRLASGGSLESKNGGFYLILQGVHKEALKELLKSKKYQFKK